MSLMTARDIHKEYFGRNVLDGVDLVIERNEVVGLVGENGTGKSTLMRILAGTETAGEGHVHVAGTVVVSYLSQHVNEMVAPEDEALPVLSSPHLERLERRIEELAEELAELSKINDSETQQANVAQEYQAAIEEFRRLDGYSYEARFAQALAGLGIRGEILNQPLHTLSGGEKMRVMLARRLLENPDLILLDEPTNHLDLAGLEWLEDYIAHYRGSALIISHDRYFLDRVATRICELQAGGITSYPGNYSNYVELKEEAERFRAQEVKRLTEEVERQQEVVQTAFEHRNFSQYHAREKLVKKLKDQLETARAVRDPGPQRMSFRFMPRETESDPSRIIISARELAMAYGSNVLFENVRFDMRARDKVVVVGPNGCGKSTLIRILLGEEERFTGDILLSSTIRYAYMDQYVRFEDEGRTVVSELMSRTDLNEGAARNLLARYGFREIDVFKKIEVLSGGERSRLYLCCLLEDQPDVLFLDEPTNHLDIPSREILEDALKDFKGAILAISHDRYFIQKCAHWLLGFSSQTIDQYDNYDYYRRSVKRSEDLLQAQQSARTEEAKAEAERKAKEHRAQNEDASETKRTSGLNRSQERQLKAKIQREMRELEVRITDLEDMQKNIEAELADADRPDVYENYADILKELEDLYELYYELGDHPLLVQE